MNNYKSLLLGAVAASVFAAGAIITPAHAGGHSDGSAAIGHKNGAFYVKSKDGNYTANTAVKLQFDFNHVSNDDDFTQGGQADTQRIRNRRFFIGAKGRAGSPNLTYGFTYNAQAGGNIDISLNYKVTPEINFKTGNYKSRGISSGQKLSSSAGWLVDDINGYGSIATGRGVGVSVHGKVAKVLSYEVKLSNGQAAGGQAVTEGGQVGFGLAYEPFGKFGSINQPDYNAKNKLRVLVEGAYVKAERSAGSGDFATYATASTAGVSNLDYWGATVAASYAGLSVTAGYEHGNFQTDDDGGSQQNGRRQMAYLLAASYMIVPKKIPLSVTYSVHNPDIAQSTSGDDVIATTGAVSVAGGTERQIGVGAAYLFNGHKNKLHASWDRISTDTAATEVDGGTNSNTVDHSLKLRWQVLF
jgi:hypothetical protein